MNMFILSKNIFRNGRRSLSLFVVIGLSVFLLYLNYSFFFGLIDSARRNVVHIFHGDAEIMPTAYKDKLTKNPWRFWIENVNDIEGHIKQNFAVKNIYPKISFHSLILFNNKTIGAKGIGVVGEREADFFYELSVIDGKHFQGNASEVMLGIGLSKKLAVKVGDTITFLTRTSFGYLNGVDLTVSGIFHSGLRRFDDNVFYMDLYQAQKLIDTDRIESISVGFNFFDKTSMPSPSSSWKDYKDKFEKKFPNYEMTLVDSFHRLKRYNKFLVGQYRIINIIILIVVLLGIFNIVSINIFNRKKEIGNLKANGYSNGDVVKLLTLEGLIIGFFSSFIGVFLVFLTCNIILHTPGLPSLPSPGFTKEQTFFLKIAFPELLIAFILGWGVTIVSTFLASLKVRNIGIVEALKD